MKGQRKRKFSPSASLRSTHQTSHPREQSRPFFSLERNYAKVKRDQDLPTLCVRFKYHKWWRICLAVRYLHCPGFPYWNYEAFELDMMPDDECQAEFRFYKNVACILKEVLNLPDEFTCYNGLTIGGIEGLCIFLKRFAYPCRYLDMIPRFARPVPQLCMTSNLVMDDLYTHLNHWNHLLTSLTFPW